MTALQSGGQATTQTRQAPTAPTAEQRQQLQDAARQLRDAIRQNVNQQIINEQANAEAARALAAQGINVPKIPPVPVAPITIQTPDGRTTIVRGAPNEVGIPKEAVDISIAFFLTVAAIIIFLPLARAFARRMDRRSGSAQIPPEVSAQLNQLNQAVDAIALEVERISEGQRFTTKLLTEQRETTASLTGGANR
ncbi:MAG TPA: hypothetical protein VJ840_00290 [Gemmatimonadaceae bacterium]|nr:hypothetical protein [Gemmatimonadaceae bacterium]